MVRVRKRLKERLGPSRNCLCHGLLARTVLLRAESEESFNNFADRLYAEYETVGATESALVDALITARWRAMRMSKIELTATRTSIAYSDVVNHSGARHLVDRVQANTPRQFDNAFDHLSLLHGRRQKRFLDPEATPRPRVRGQTNPIEL